MLAFITRRLGVVTSRRRWSFRLGNKWIRGGRRRRKGRKRRKCSFVVRLSEMFIWIAPFYLDSIPSLLFQLSAGVASAASAAFVSSWTSFLFCFVIFFKIDFTSSFSIVEETEWRTLSVSPSNETQPTLNYVNDVERMLDPSIDLHSKHSANCPWMWFHEQFQQFAIQTRWNPNEIGWNQLKSESMFTVPAMGFESILKRCWNAVFNQSINTV